MQISNILQQPAGMAVPKCIKCRRWRQHRAFEPFFTVDISILVASADGTVDGRTL